jgi:hypothetical protein
MAQEWHNARCGGLAQIGAPCTAKRADLRNVGQADPP